MTFEWDEQKNVSNKKKHGIDFGFAQAVFLDPYGFDVVDCVVDDEERYKFFGAILENIFLVVYVERKQQTIRLISARKTTKKEREVYFERRKVF